MTNEYIIGVRKELGLSQAQFGQLFDVHPMTVSKWERGILNPSPYQQTLMDEFAKAAAKDSKEVKNELVKLLIGAGVIAALYFLLTKAK